MKNPFSPDAGGELNLKRNAFDHSHQNLFSTDFGRLTPCLCHEVIPGDSVRIKPTLAIQGMPTVFPLQTRLRASVEFYYCRNRCVHDEFEDFIFKTKDVEQPWLQMDDERAKQMIATGSLGDYLGVATTVGNSSEKWRVLPFGSDMYFGSFSGNVNSAMDLFVSLLDNGSIPYPVSGFDVGYRTSSTTSDLFGLRISNFLEEPVYKVSIPLNFTLSNQTLLSMKAIVFPHNGKAFLASKGISVVDSQFQFSLYFPDDFNFSNGYTIGIVYLGRSGNDFDVNSYFSSTYQAVRVPVSWMISNGLYLSSTVDDATSPSQISANPYVGNTPSIKLNALPFRHYEQVCNYYYRNDKNNPYVLNGDVQYNEFIPSHASGPDTNIYAFHYKNWELDRFTSAVQSPQFGEAPLVGLTFTGSDTARLTFQSDDGEYFATVGVDGDKVTTIEDFSQDIPSANLRKLAESIQYGISINDLRVTNSFQRFLENVMRRGLRYRNQLKSHFGSSVDYPDIDIPQYIGGFSGELNVGKVTSMADTDNAPLGDFNGSLSGVISGQRDITHYCPEHGFILGIVSITPVPVYGQVTEKYMNKHDAFDYYLPEFGKIGMVPMHYSDVAPLQTGTGQSVDDVFGYQKAWYEYMNSFDKVHGFFRTNLKDFVLQRLFAERPELVADFTQINPNQLTDVFQSRNISDAYGISDKFLCNMYFNLVVKSVVPRYGTPSLE